MTIFNSVKTAKIALEDGSIFAGRSFGAEGTVLGEVVFNTGMSGYQEVLTDPSYKGQIVAMTYPLIGNYGVNADFAESRKVFLEGFVVKESSFFASNWQSEMPLDRYLKDSGIVAVDGVDTRALTRHIRLRGAMRGVISTEEMSDTQLTRMAQESPGLKGRDLVAEVVCAKAYDWCGEGEYKVVAVDCGIKYNILRCLQERHCAVHVVPYSTSSSDILKLKPDGLFLSNGPGDPAAVAYVADTIKELLGKVPIFGICLGHQMLAQALGASTYKLKFGHHGVNHPVKDLRDGRIAITVQNHGFCVDHKTLGGDIEITHINLNDSTVEGLRHKNIPAFSVQYHPEAGPGPHDARRLFDEFIKMMKS